MRAALAPLRLPGFPRLAFAYTVNELGNWLGEIALAVLVFEETGSALATAALFLGMKFLPALLSQGVVARVEVTGTRVGLPAIYAAEGLTFVALAAVADNFLLATIVALATLDGALALAGRALTRASAAAVLAPSGQLRQGNALFNICFTAVGALGPLIGGLVVAGLGVQTALLLDAASFLVVAVTLAAGSSIPVVKAVREPWRARLREGLAYVAGQALLRRLLVAQSAAFVFFAAVIPVEILYAKETLDAGDSGYGILLASWGCGMVLGSLLFAAARRASLRSLLLFSTIAVGISYLIMSAASGLMVACLAAALGGAGNGVQWVSMISTIQAATADRFQARVLGLLESLGSAMPGLGFALGGLIAYTVEPRATFALAGAGVLAVVAVSTPLLRRTDWSAADAAAPPLEEAAELDTPKPPPVVVNGPVASARLEAQKAHRH